MPCRIIIADTPEGEAVVRAWLEQDRTGRGSAAYVPAGPGGPLQEPLRQQTLLPVGMTARQTGTCARQEEIPPGFLYILHV